MGDAGDRVDTLRDDRIADSDQLSERDRDALVEFSDELFFRTSEYSDHRHEKLLRHCVRMAEHAGNDFADVLEDREVTKDVVRWVNRKYDNEETNRDYRVALRIFAKRMTNGEDDLPDSVSWVSGQTSSSYDPQPDPAEMLHWDEHILPMIDATNNNRDAAIIAVAWDAGARSGEFRNLTIGDVVDHTHGLQITVDGKTGQRTVTLIPSVPQLQRWLGDHPAPDDPDTPLWCKLHEPEELSFRMFKKILETAAESADVDRPVTLTNFRKSSASHLASQGMSQAHIEERLGWTRGSSVAARYVSVFAEDADRELARIHGREVEEEEPDPIAPVACPRCGRDTPRDEEFCVWCDQAIDHGAVEQLKTDEREVQRLLLGIAKDNPGLLDEVEEREQILTALQDNPDLQRKASEFLDEIGVEH